MTEDNDKIIALLSSILEKQIANSESLLKIKDKSIDYLFDLWKRYEAKCDILESELKDARIVIAALERHIEKHSGLPDIKDNPDYYKI